MVRVIFFVIIFFLFGCIQFKNDLSKKSEILTREETDSIEEDMRSYLTHFSTLDSSKDGIYFSYQMAVEWEPSAYLFFYDYADSVITCPFVSKSRRFCFVIKVNGKDVPYRLFEEKNSLNLYSMSQDRILGYEKIGAKKRYFRLRGRCYCSDDESLLEQNMNDSNKIILNNKIFDYMKFLSKISNSMMKNNLKTN